MPGIINPYLTRQMQYGQRQPGTMEEFMRAPQLFAPSGASHQEKFSPVASVVDPMGFQRASGSGSNTTKGALLGPIARLFG